MTGDTNHPQQFSPSSGKITRRVSGADFSAPVAPAVERPAPVVAAPAVDIPAAPAAAPWATAGDVPPAAPAPRPKPEQPAPMAAPQPVPQQFQPPQPLNNQPRPMAPQPRPAGPQQYPMPQQRPIPQQPQQQKKSSNRGLIIAVIIMLVLVLVAALAVGGFFVYKNFLADDSAAQDTSTSQYYEKAREFEKNGDTQQAILYYTLTISEDPDNANPYYRRGKLYYDTGRYAAAVEDMENAKQRTNDPSQLEKINSVLDKANQQLQGQPNETVPSYTTAPPAPTPPAMPGYEQTVSTYYVEASGGLNMRSIASTTGEVLTSLPDGTAVQPITWSDGWAKVSYQGLTGWVSGQYLTPGAYASARYRVTSYGGTTLHISANDTMTIPNGTMVVPYDWDGIWCMVSYNGHVGWVNSNDLEFYIPY